MIGIIFLLNLEYAPYLTRYTDIFDASNTKYEIITWNRLPETTKELNLVTYSKPAALGDSKIKKLADFYSYRRFLIDTINKNNYDKLILLTTLTGIMLMPFIKKKYRNRYILDIRDYTFENYSIYRWIEKSLIEGSRYTMISSPGFKTFLPKNFNYMTVHNIIPKEMDYTQTCTSCDDKIRIVFIGAVRYFDTDKKIVDAFGNDERFEIYYHGYGVTYEKLKTYVEGKYNNIFVTGKYDRNDKPKLMRNATVINGYYDEHLTLNQQLVSNKYYDALIYKVPFWGNPNTYVGKISIEQGFGLNVVLDADVKDNLYNELMHMNRNVFIQSCERNLKLVLEEDRAFQKGVLNFINE